MSLSFNEYTGNEYLANVMQTPIYTFSTHFLTDLRREFIFPCLKPLQEQKCLNFTLEIPPIILMRRNFETWERERMDTQEQTYLLWFEMH